MNILVVTDLSIFFSLFSGLSLNVSLEDRSAPNQLLASAVEDVHNQRPDQHLFHRRRHAHPAEPAPTPASAESVIPGFEVSLRVG